MPEEDYPLTRLDVGCIGGIFICGLIGLVLVARDFWSCVMQ